LVFVDDREAVKEFCFDKGRIGDLLFGAERWRQKSEEEMERMVRKNNAVLAGILFNYRLFK
jgi:hypothetical protein